MFTAWHLISLIFNAQLSSLRIVPFSWMNRLKDSIYTLGFFKSKLVFKTKLILMNGSLHN